MMLCAQGGACSPAGGRRYTVHAGLSCADAAAILPQAGKGTEKKEAKTAAAGGDSLDDIFGSAKIKGKSGAPKNPPASAASADAATLKSASSGRTALPLCYMLRRAARGAPDARACGHVVPVPVAVLHALTRVGPVDRS